MIRPLLRLRPVRWVAAQRWLLFDIALAVVLVVASVDGQDQGGGGWWWVGAMPLVAGLVIRRRWPLIAFVVAAGGAMLRHLDPDIQLDALDLAVPLTLYTLASGGRSRRVAAIALAAALLATGGLSVIFVVTKQDARAADIPGQADMEQLRTKIGFSISEEEFRNIQQKSVQPPPSVNDLVSQAVGQALGVMLIFGLAYAVGDSVRSRRAHLRAVEQRAADLEREQQQRVALATAAERARISRELHDVVAHGLSVIVVQAQGAAAALERHPDRAAEALQHVIATGRDSLVDMRRLLGLVQQRGGDDPALAPQLGVGALPELVDRVRAAGTSVTLVIDGDPVPLPATVDLSAYRIAQEALTNTIKHAGRGASVRLRLDFQPDRLEIDVVDDGVGGAPVDHGTGLRGIAERVAMLSGEWSAGPGPERGFRVWAALPLVHPGAAPATTGAPE